MGSAASRQCVRVRVPSRGALAIGKFKRFKRIAMRCDKTTDSYAAFVALACALMLVKSVHRD